MDLASTAPPADPAVPHGLGRREIDLVFIARHLTIVGYMLTTYVGRTHLPWWEPASDLGLVVPYSLWCHRVTRRRGEVPGWLPTVDVAICLAWLAAEPRLAFPLISLMLATLTLNALATRPGALWRSFGLGALGTAVMGIARDGQDGAIAALRFTMVGTTTLFALEVVRRAFLRAQDQLRTRSTHDQLTALANRELLRQALDAAATSGPSAVLLVDLDDFKEINDALGHHVGDRVLVEIADRLRRIAGTGDLAARLGGDEFAVVLAGAGRDRATVTADRVTATIARPVEVDGLLLEVGSSIGIALAPEHGTDAEALLQRADVAMYQAKRTGRAFRVYDAAEDTSSVRRVTLLGELRHAVALDQMELWYQPIVDLRTGRTEALEALVRWRHPRHGLLLPGEFIELAELSGAIDALTRWVVTRALDDLDLLDGTGRRLGMACNLSVRNLRDPALTEWLAELTRQAPDRAARLHLELTESQLMDDPTAARDVLGRLGGLGIGCSIDDFGTGYSSLSLLRHVRATALKVDRSFVTDLLTEPESRILVSSMIELGHHLGMTVVAEGVEDAGVLDALRELGCDRAQGYLLSPPLPIDDIRAFVAAEAATASTGGASTHPPRRPG